MGRLINSPVDFGSVEMLEAGSSAGLVVVDRLYSTRWAGGSWKLGRLFLAMRIAGNNEVASAVRSSIFDLEAGKLAVQYGEPDADLAGGNVMSAFYTGKYAAVTHAALITLVRPPGFDGIGASWTVFGKGCVMTADGPGVRESVKYGGRQEVGFADEEYAPYGPSGSGTIAVGMSSGSNTIGIKMPVGGRIEPVLQVKY